MPSYLDFQASNWYYSFVHILINRLTDRGIAAIRADLNDMEFEFVQGTVLHTEGTKELKCITFQ